ncbi:hypothetical protein [Treponema endosymbiont of Eucomonympha sp.]|jgi:uncharacterized membrane protein|uniref:hypothetical protein n=1 Tax=Treponema endosymbiont of Eucomonympha sp. TaxID=1580831 RepID=UPI00075152ED|nr:hypothetical protein [Treponema endosymbiont of Eucomonympha sp.]
MAKGAEQACGKVLLARVPSDNSHILREQNLSALLVPAMEPYPGTKVSGIVQIVSRAAVMLPTSSAAFIPTEL